MAQYTLKQRFEAAAGWLTSTPAAASLPNNTKLEIYGLYKFITVGEPEQLLGRARADNRTGSRPGIFYPAPRAKYDAWQSTYTKYTSASSSSSSSGSSPDSGSREKAEDEARERYIEIARGVGWTDEGLADEEDEEIDFDESDTAPTSAETKKSAGAGMGPKVSVMAQEPEANELAAVSPLHDAVVEDRFSDVKDILTSDNKQVNRKDEFGNTPLHLAVDRGHVDMTKLLIASGADLTALDEDGQTPLDIANVLDRHDLVAILQ